MKDHLKIYRVDSVTSFYQRQKGKILLKTVGFGLSLGVVGTLTVGALGTKSESDIVGPAGAGLAIGLMTGIMIGLVSGLANYQKFVWTNENIINCFQYDGAIFIQGRRGCFTSFN